MSLPGYEAACENGYEKAQSSAVEGHPASGGGNVSPPPMVQPSPAAYLVQASPPPYFISNPQIQHIVTAPAVLQSSHPMKVHQTFLKGKPKTLGIAMIVTSFVQIALGIALCFYPNFLTLYSGIVFWGPVMYILAGSFSIAAEEKRSCRLMKGSVIMNIKAMVTSLLAGIFNVVDIVVLSSESCAQRGGHQYGYSHYGYTCDPDYSVSVGLIAAVLVTDLLLFGMSTFLSVFGCRSLKHVPPFHQVLVIQNGTVSSAPSSTQPPLFLQPEPYPPQCFIPGVPTK